MRCIYCFIVVVGLTALNSCAAPHALPTAGPRDRAPMMILDPGPEDVYVRIVDVGPGLCAVVLVPGGQSMVFDAGYWNGEHCINAVRALIRGETIDLIVISHSDADHLGDCCSDLRREILVGEPRSTGPWGTAWSYVVRSVEAPGAPTPHKTSEAIRRRILPRR